MSGAIVWTEPKTIRTVDLDMSTRLPQQCQYSDKLSILFEPRHHRQTYSHFLF